MKSVKPGRGPSAMGVWGSVMMAIFGVFWTIMATSMGAPAIFPIFGLLFISMAIISGVYDFRNATGKKRYSAFDITEEGEEPDPLNERFGEQDQPNGDFGQESAGGFCPYCGALTEADYEFCRTCGQKLN